MTPVDQALSLALDALPLRPAQTLPLVDALGRVLAADVHALLDLPPFDQSAVDGYAVRHADIAAAHPDAPVTLPIAQTIAAGARDGAPRLAPQTAARIFTGGWLPDGADTSVRQEVTRREGDRVHVQRVVEPGADIRRHGEELRRGDLVAGAPTRITPGLLAAIAMAGVAEVAVRRAPRLALLVTGDEVVAPGTALAPGQVADANGPLLRAHLQHWGYSDLTLDYVDDRFESVQAALGRAFARADLVLTTGGVSVGDHDHVPAAAEAAGARRVLWKVAQKPGMPLYVAAHPQGARLFGLPGNPASVLVNLLVYVRPALAALEGAAAPAWRRGRLARDIRAEAGKTLWLRMRESADEAGAPTLEPLPRQASHMLSNLAQANALVRVPPVAEGRVAAGRILEFLPLN